tara:strand:+ start:2366 stop:2536 length:171 start_codon:yes stop_codon:yes gene_type:complete
MTKPEDKTIIEFLKFAKRQPKLSALLIIVLGIDIAIQVFSFFQTSIGEAILTRFFL